MSAVTLRGVKRALLLLLLLVLLLILSCVALVSSQTGSRWLLQQIAHQVPGLQLDGVQGRLRDRIQVAHLQYASSDMALEGQQLVFQWRPWQLLQGRLQLQALTLEQLELSLPSSVDEQPSPPTAPFPLSLPDTIALPLQLEVEQLALAHLQITQAGQIYPFEGVALSLHTEADRLLLQHLDVSSPWGDLNLSGSLTLGADYALELNSRARLRLPEQPQLNLSGSLRGPLDALVLEQKLSGPLEARLQGQLNGLRRTQPEWQLALQVEQLDAAALFPQQALELDDISASLDASGGIDHAVIDLEAAAAQPETGALTLALRAQAAAQQLRIEQLTLQQPASAAELQLNGTLSDPLGDPVLDLRGEWHGLHWPLSPAEVQWSSPSGTLRLVGPLSAVGFNFSTSLQGIDLPEISLAGSGLASPEQIRGLQLQAEALGGQLRAQGQLGWQPAPNWQLQLDAEHLDPGRFWPQWPGQISARLQTEGQISNRAGSLQPEGRLQLQSLSGQLRSQPLSGQGLVQYRDAQLQIEQLALGWGSARVQSSGQLGEQLALDWSLQIPQLAQLLPQGKGQLSAEGRLQGPRMRPALRAQLDARQLQWHDYRLEQAAGRARFDLQGDEAADISLTASGIGIGDQVLERLALNIQGPQQALVTRLALNGEQGALNLVTQGTLTTRTDSWLYEGRLNELALRQPLAGEWSLEVPAALELGSAGYRLGASCLLSREHDGQLCARGEWDSAGQGQGEWQLRNLPLTLLAPWLPSDLRLQGAVTAEGEFQQRQQQLDYRLALRLPRARLSRRGADLELNLDSTEFQLEGSTQQARARLRAPLNELGGELTGQLQLDDLSGARRLAGQLSLALPDLRPLGVLSPAVEIVQGRADARIDLSGTLNRPGIEGQLRVEDGILDLPAAGIRLQAVTLSLADDPAAPGELLLTGSARSGDGNLALEGRLLPLAQRVRLEVKGDQFQSMDTAAVQMLISPRLQLDATPEQVQLRGEILIPQALIQPPPRSLSAPAPSADLVLLDTADTAAASSPIVTDVELSIRLGDQVRVDAFGFDGLLNGTLNLKQSGTGVARGSGRVGVNSGEYSLYGQTLKITRGSLLFSGGPVTNPGLDLRVERTLEDVQVGAVVSGTLRTPELTLTSTPSMPDNSILSWLLLGRAPGQSSAGEQQLMMRLAMALATRGGGHITERLQDTLKVDELGFAGGDELEDTAFYIGKYLNPDLYIKYGIGLVEPVSTFLIRYRLSSRWSLETETSASASGGDLIYSFER